MGKKKKNIMITCINTFTVIISKFCVKTVSFLKRDIRKMNFS